MNKTTMNSNHQMRFGWLALALAATTAAAQTQDEAKLAAAISKGDELSLNHFGAAFRAGFNIKPSFKNIGGFPERIIRDPTLPQDHTYSDGYVRTDVTGNDHGPAPDDHATWFWAYAAPSQISPGGDSVLMHIDSSAPIASTKGEGDEPLPGFELTYSRQLGELGKARWGVEAAFGYTGFDFHNEGDAVAAGRRTDQYQFSPNAGAPLPPGFPSDPYGGNGPGTFSGPGQLLLDTIETSSVGSALVVGKRRFDGAIFSGRLGPYLEIPLCRKSSVWLGGGLALVGVQSNFRYDEAVTIADVVGTEGHNASGSHGDVLVGYYLSGSLSVALSSRLSLFGGVQYQSVGTYTHPLDNVGTYTGLLDSKAAQLDLGDTFFVTVGLTWSF